MASGSVALEALGHASSGAVGTALATACLYPLDLVTTRLKAQQQSSPSAERYDGVIDAFRSILQHEGGISALYRGLGADVGKSIVDSFLFFGFYSYLSRSQGGTAPRALQELALGALAGASARAFTTPISNVVTRKQTSSSGQESLAQILGSIREEAGILGLWSGYSATLILTLNPSITFLVNRRLVKRILPALEEEDIPVAWVAFLLAASSKAVATALTYPFQTAKTRLQLSMEPDDGELDGNRDKSRRAGASRDSFALRLMKLVDKSIFGVILRTIRSEGFRALYRGIQGELLKSFFSHGLTMLTKGIIHRFIMRLWILASPHLRQKLLKRS
jgi:solute carrier family 25 (peroxisomal adenine nucleotide transporter), member 17